MTSDLYVDQDYVGEYHDVLNDLAKTGFSIDKLRIPGDKVFRRTSGGNYITGARQYTEPAVDRPFFMAKLNAAISYAHRAIPAPTVGPAPLVDSRRVLVVYGRNQAISRAMFAFLRAIGLNPQEFSSLRHATGQGSPWVGDILRNAFASSAAFVVVLTGDDEARVLKQFLRDHDPQSERELTPQARQNVLFEAGMAFGFDERRTIIVEVGPTRPFSDVLGRHTVRLNNTAERRNELAQRLKDAGCDVNLTGDLWLSEGDFRLDAAAPSPEPEAVGPDSVGAPAEDEPPGFLELLADQQVALTELIPTLESLSEVQQRISTAVESSGMTADADPITKLRLANALAEALTPLISEYASYVAQYEDQLKRVSAGVNYLLGRMEEEPALLDQAPTFAASSHTLRESVDSWNLSDLRKALTVPAKAARSLAKPLRSWDAAIGRLDNSSAVIRAWDDRVQAVVARRNPLPPAPEAATNTHSQ